MTHTIRLPYHDRYPYSPITQRKDAAGDADQWAGVPDKRKLLEE